MNTAILSGVILLALVSGSFSQVVERAQRASGLVDFTAGNPGETGIEIRTITDGRGRIANAHIRTHGNEAFVSGQIERRAGTSAPAWSHVDVLVVDRGGRIVESATARYLPRDVPGGPRAGARRSGFTTRLQKIPPAGAIVKVAFHGSSLGDCQLPPAT